MPLLDKDLSLEKLLRMAMINGAFELEEKLTGQRIDVNKKEKDATILISNFDKIETHRDKDVAFFVGVTGSGRSTLVNYLLGHKLVKSEAFLSSKLDVEKENSNKLPIAPIGHSIKTETGLVNLYGVQDNDNVHYSDCGSFDVEGGFTNDDIMDMANLISVRLAMQLARSVRLVWTISQNSLSDYTWPVQVHRDMHFHLKTLFMNFSSFSPECITVVITNLYESQDGLDRTEVQSYLRKRYENRMHKLNLKEAEINIDKNEEYNVFLYNLLAKAPHFIIGDYDSDETREKIKREILGSKVIDRSHIYSPKNTDICLIAMIKLEKYILSRGKLLDDISANSLTIDKIHFGKWSMYGSADVLRRRLTAARELKRALVEGIDSSILKDHMQEFERGHLKNIFEVLKPRIRQCVDALEVRL